MEKWKLVTAAAAVGVATVGGLAVSSSVVAADRAAIYSSAMSAYTTDMTTFCTTNVPAERTGVNAHASTVVTQMCAKPR